MGNVGHIIDLRSDTVTKPTPDMRQAMANAEVGDDVYGEDPTVRRLEELAAEKLGKEAALFVTSGTQGNQVAIATHARTGEEIITESQAHIFYYEAAGISVLAGAQVRQVPGNAGVMAVEDVRAAIRPTTDIHQPRTALISIENTHNRAGGTVVPMDNLAGIHDLALAHDVPVHIDGARLFNAAVALGVPAAEIAKHAETVQFCLSKGLCAPVGSLLVGSRSFIEAARVWRKRLGGGLRQAGVIAAPGIIALTTMVDRLAEDHAKARRLAHGLSAIRGIAVPLETVQTNIVIVDIGQTKIPVPSFVETLKQNGVLASSFGGSLVRFVTHHDVSEADIDEALQKISRTAGGSI